MNPVAKVVPKERTSHPEEKTEVKKTAIDVRRPFGELDVQTEFNTPSDLINHVVSPLDRVEVSSPLPVALGVRFSDAELEFSEEEIAAEEQTIEKLRERLEQAEMDLASERALRKRSDKNLVKLAKQLKARAADSDLKERKLIQMVKSINSLEEQLQNKHQRKDRASDMSVKATESQIADLRSELDTAKLQVESLQAKLVGHLNFTFLAIFVTLLAFAVQANMFGTK